MPMNVKHLNYFVEIARAGSFSRAALHLGIAQPTLSRQVNQLERDLNARLLNRNGHGVTLTDAGEKLLHHGNAAIQHLETAKQEISALQESPRDVTVVGLPAGLASQFAHPLLTFFNNRFPEAHLIIEEAYSELVQDWLNEGKLDIAIVFEGIRSISAPFDKIMDVQLYLVGSKESPFKNKKQIDVKKLKDIPLILPSRPHTQRVMLEQKARRLQFTLNIAQEATGIHVTKALVQATNIHTILPLPVFKPEIKSGDLIAVPIVNPILTCQLNLLASAYKSLSKPAKAIVREIKKLLNDY